MKVFGVGLNKTGTTTLGVCLKSLGFTHKSSDLDLTLCVERGDLDPVFEVCDRFDSFEDWPWPLIYRELDERYPGSRFVLTTRSSPEVWIRSLKKHATLTGPTEFRRIAYGHEMPHGNEESHRAVYLRHNQAVRDHFRDRPDRLLEVCWEHGHGWRELCVFLDRDVPDQAFPHANRSSGKRKRIFMSSAKRLVRSWVTDPADGAGPARS
jgi:hypothetical protein